MVGRYNRISKYRYEFKKTHVYRRMASNLKQFEAKLLVNIESKRILKYQYEFKISRACITEWR